MFGGNHTRIAQNSIPAADLSVYMLYAGFYLNSTPQIAVRSGYVKQMHNPLEYIVVQFMYLMSFSASPIIILSPTNYCNWPSPNWPWQSLAWWVMLIKQLYSRLGKHGKAGH